MKKVQKDYAFEVTLDRPESLDRLNKRLSDLGVSALVEKPEGNPGQYQLVVSYPVTGQELMTRLCEKSDRVVTVVDEMGKIYSNKPLAVPEVVVESAPAKIEEPAPVVEIKKTVAPAPALKEALDVSKIVKGITESIDANLQTLRNELQEEKAAATRYQQFSELKTSAAISAINENVANLQSVLVGLSNEMSKLNNIVSEAMENYNKKLIELAETSNRLNHRVVKEVKRDERGYITEVTEKIITE